MAQIEKYQLKHRMTLRLTDKLMDYLSQRSNECTITPSEYIRQLISQDMKNRKMADSIINELPKEIIARLKIDND